MKSPCSRWAMPLRLLSLAVIGTLVYIVGCSSSQYANSRHAPSASSARSADAGQSISSDSSTFTLAPRTNVPGSLGGGGREPLVPYDDVLGYPSSWPDGSVARPPNGDTTRPRRVFGDPGTGGPALSQLVPPQS